ncbi:MAG: outer membrane beta-barrel protein [Hyphomicrobium sp.]
MIVVGEPGVHDNGVDPAATNPQWPDDAEAIEDPSDRSDPLLFQIEDIDAVRDNRTTYRLARIEPYDPVGVTIGSFVLFPEVSIGGLWNSNVFKSPIARSDVALDFRPAARFVSKWSRHALELRGGAVLSSYNDFNSENDETYAIEARGRLDVSRRTDIQAVVGHESSLESRSAIDANSAGNRLKTHANRAELAINHRLNRLSVRLRGSIGDHTFGDTEILGMSFSNSDRDYTEAEGAVRVAWQFKPTFSAFAETAVNQRDYDRPATSDLISRSSDGARYRLGVSFGNSGQVMRGEVSLGYGRQSPDDGQLESVDGLILDANATWRISELTSVLFNGRSDVAETTTANVGGAFSRLASIEIRHALRRHVVASASLSYATQDSQDGVIDDRERRVGLGLEYFVNPNTVLFGNYLHTAFKGVGVDSDFDADEVRMGLRLRN